MADRPFENHPTGKLVELAQKQIDVVYSVESNALTALHIIVELGIRLSAIENSVRQEPA